MQVLSYQKLTYDSLVSKLDDPTITPDVKRSLLRRYLFPARLLTVHGVYLQVHAAVITGAPTQLISVQCSPLTDKVSCVLPRHSGAALAKVARVLCGVREASAALHRLFEDPPLDLLPLDALPAYPIPYLLRSLLVTQPEHLFDGKLVWSGTYVSSRGGAPQPNSDHQQQQLSGSAQTPRGSSGGNLIPVVVKFAERYGLEVHRQWAAAGAAVPLLDALCTPGASGSYSPSYGYSCIGMPDLDEEGCVMVSLLTDGALLGQGACAGVAGQVHGDLRTVNAMMRPNDRKLLFVDFGWAGQAGEARYPLDLNQAMFGNGAEPGGLITADHDRLMVESW